MKQCKDCNWFNACIARKGDACWHFAPIRRTFWAPRILLLALALLLGGCTAITYNPQTQEVKYQSLGGKSFDSLSILRLDDGSIEIVVNKYQHEGIGPIVEGAVRGALQGVKP